MRLSATEEYGLRCLLALAREGTEGQLSITEIAEKEGISAPYASKLLSLLRKAGLVTAVRGRKGGFQIAYEPSHITLLEVVTSLGGPLIDPDHCRKRTGQRDHCVHGLDCVVREVLGGVAEYIRNYLSAITLQDMIERVIPPVETSFADTLTVFRAAPSAVDNEEEETRTGSPPPSRSGKSA